MTIYPPCRSLMKFGVFKNLIETYYRFRIRRPCYVKWQNERWTLVTLDC